VRHFQKPGQQSPKPVGRKGVPGQNPSQEHRESPATTATSTAIGTVDPLSPQLATGGIVRIIAAQTAVPIQRLPAATVGAGLPLERKSSSFNASSSRTKRYLD
jgi:hypothetical protein